MEKLHNTESQFSKCCTFFSRDLLSIKLSVLKVVLIQGDTDSKICQTDEKWKHTAFMTIDTTYEKIVKKWKKLHKYQFNI